MELIAYVKPERLRMAVTLMVGLLHMLGATRLKFTLFPRARLELKLSPGMRFRHWDAGIVAGLFRSPEDPKLIGLDCAMFALMMAMSRMKDLLREGDVGMWFPLWLPNTCGTSEGPPERCRLAWRAGRIRPFSTENPDCWWPGPDVCCFGYDPATAFHPVTRRKIYECQWVCRVADDLYAGLDEDGVHFLSCDEWSAKVAASNDGKKPEFLTYTDE